MSKMVESHWSNQKGPKSRDCNQLVISQEAADNPHETRGNFLEPVEAFKQPEEHKSRMTLTNDEFNSRSYWLAVSKAKQYNRHVSAARSCLATFVCSFPRRLVVQITCPFRLLAPKSQPGSHAFMNAPLFAALQPSSNHMHNSLDS